MPKYTSFYVSFTSVTEAEAIRAALESKGFKVDAANLRRAKSCLGDEKHYANIGNRALDNAPNDKIKNYGYGANCNQGMVHLNGIGELVAFLDSGKHIASEEKEYVIIETVTRKMKVKAVGAGEAIEKARNGKYEWAEETPADFQFSEEN